MMEKICSVVLFVAAFMAIGYVGGFENDALTLSGFIVRELICAVVCGICVLGLNKAESRRV
jgi:hypothetical protein